MCRSATHCRRRRTPTEPNGNGAGQNDFNQLGEQERGPSLLDQRHRAVIFLSYQLPYHVTVGTVSSLASSKPFNATTGVDNNGDGNNNDRPVVNGVVASRYAFRGTPIYDTSLFAEVRLLATGSKSIVLRAEMFNAFNHANVLGRNGTYSDTSIDRWRRSARRVPGWRTSILAA